MCLSLYSKLMTIKIQFQKQKQRLKRLIIIDKDLLGLSNHNTRLSLSSCLKGLAEKGLWFTLSLDGKRIWGRTKVYRPPCPNEVFRGQGRVKTLNPS